MFDSKQKYEGNYVRYDFLDKATGHSFSVVPERGAVLTSLKFNGLPVIDGYTRASDLKSLAWAKSALLVPFPNRLKDGSYFFEGKMYQFPINEKNTHTAIHGFGLSKKMKVTELECFEGGARISCAYKDSGRRKAYPFPHHFTVFYSLRKNAFAMEMCIQNTGNSTMPAGLGWHPYFSLGKSIDAHKLKLPAGFPLKKVLVYNNMIPTGQFEDFNKFQRSEKIGNTRLDNCFFIETKNKKPNRFEIKLTFEKRRIVYWQDTATSPYVQLFTPPKRNSLAIEPMTCNIDAFNNKGGLRLLAPGEILRLSCGVDFVK